MIIENEVLELVSKYLAKGERAYFESYSLWLQLKDETKQAKARKIFSELFVNYDGQIQISPAGSEYVIDFI